jgi:hypothetical protein
MALLIECMLKCAPILNDNADIVREAMLQQRSFIPLTKVLSTRNEKLNLSLECKSVVG